MSLFSRRRSIAVTLTWMNVLVSGIALLIAYFSFLGYDLLVFRQAAVNGLSGDAQIIGANSVSAILFNDEYAAQATLSALSKSDNVVAAAIYTQQGTTFAQYLRDKSFSIDARPFPANVNSAYWIDGQQVLVASRIMFQGKPVGTVYIEAYLRDLRQQALRYAAIAGAILMLCLAVAVLAGAAFRRWLARPIVSLAQTARMVSRYRDYSLRVESSDVYDELISLTEAFNEMLAEIQKRDEALEQARNKMELRVEERTAQLRAANQELEAFSYTVAHDLRGPLDLISGNCYLMQSEPRAMGEVGRPMLDRIVSSVTDMSDLIDDLLNLSRASSAGLHVAPIDLSLLAETILEDLAKAYPERDVRRVVEKGCYGVADPGLMRIVMQNLLRNAWKFTGRTGGATIEFGCKGGKADPTFFVRDNGAGFDQLLAERLFKPFQRLHAESDFSGTGIGLATVQRIVARHEGRIWAEGEVGKGATFYFTLGR